MSGMTASNQRHRTGLKRTITCMTVLALVAVVAVLAFATAALAQPVKVTRLTGAYAGELAVSLNKSQILQTDAAFGRVSVGNPEIADVLPLNDRTIYVLGKQVGVTNLTLYSKDDRPLAILDISVVYDVQSSEIASERALSQGAGRDPQHRRIDCLERPGFRRCGFGSDLNCRPAICTEQGNQSAYVTRQSASHARGQVRRGITLAVARSRHHAEPVGGRQSQPAADADRTRGDRNPVFRGSYRPPATSRSTS